MRRDFEAAAQILPTIPQVIPPPYLPCISTVSPYISLTTASRCAPPLNPSPSHTLAIARTLTLVLTLTPTLALALTLALTLPLGR